jgi:hypothetical protein
LKQSLPTKGLQIPGHLQQYMLITLLMPMVSAGFGL